MTDNTYLAAAPRLLLVATLDRSLRNFYPHMDACRAAGFRVDVACRISTFEDEMWTHCNRLFNLPFRRFPLNPLNLLTLAKLKAVIDSHHYDIVHAHTPAGGMIGRAAATLAHTPVRIYMAHGFHFHPEGSRVSNFVFTQAERFAGNYLSDLVEVINTEDYASALRYKIVSKDKLIMIDGTGINTPRFDPANVSAADRQSVIDELGLTPGSPVVGVIAEMIPRKRLHDTLETVAILKAAYPNITLLLLGDGDQRAELEASAVEKGIAENCRFLGFRRDLPRFVSAMDIFVFSTQQEGLPAALMEAMCMGIVSVATDIRGNRDIIMSGENGLLVPLGQPRAMADACIRLIEDRALASTLAAKGRDLIISKYDTQRTVEQQMSAYRRVLLSAKNAGRLRPDISLSFKC